jgi:signal transduction histidine kinase
MRRHPTLRIDDGAVLIAVADTGIGMTAEEAARLFEDFVRIKNEKTRHILGSGLGLSIVKKLAALYGGDALVTSEPNVGSTFTVVLKRAYAEGRA